LVFCKESKKLSYIGETDLTKEEFISWSSSLWTFAPQTNQKKIGHPAMFPIELVKRCLKMFSYRDAVVLDPFMGSGTTAVGCKLYGRHYIGFEISKKYCDIANERIVNANLLYEAYRDENHTVPNIEIDTKTDGDRLF
jgi:DNA modification methylase